MAPIFTNVRPFFRDLMWKTGTPRIWYETLQRGKYEDGLVAPDPWIYFLSSQLQHLKGWDADSSSDPVHRLLRAVVAGPGLLPSLEAGFAYSETYCLSNH